MRVVRLSDPATLPVSLSEVKDHLRIEQDEIDFDADLEALIAAASAYVSEETHTTLISTQLSATWDCFPSGSVRIPGWPVVSIESVEYKDADGADQVLPAGDMQGELIQSPATIRPAVGGTWPTTQADTVDAVTIHFTAGYGDSSSDVPPMFRAMIKLLVAHWFKHREAVGSTNSIIELAFNALRDQVRVNEWEEFLNR